MHSLALAFAPVGYAVAAFALVGSVHWTLVGLAAVARRVHGRGA